MWERKATFIGGRSGEIPYVVIIRLSPFKQLVILQVGGVWECNIPFIFKVHYCFFSSIVCKWCREGVVHLSSSLFVWKNQESRPQAFYSQQGVRLWKNADLKIVRIPYFCTTSFGKALNIYRFRNLCLSGIANEYYISIAVNTPISFHDIHGGQLLLGWQSSLQERLAACHIVEKSFGATSFPPCLGRHKLRSPDTERHTRLNILPRIASSFVEHHLVYSCAEGTVTYRF